MARNPNGQAALFHDMAWGKHYRLLPVIAFKNQGYLSKNKAIGSGSHIIIFKPGNARFSGLAPSLSSYSFHGTGRRTILKCAYSYYIVRHGAQQFDVFDNTNGIR